MKTPMGIMVSAISFILMLQGDASHAQSDELFNPAMSRIIEEIRQNYDRILRARPKPEQMIQGRLCTIHYSAGAGLAGIVEEHQYRCTQPVASFPTFSYQFKIPDLSPEVTRQADGSCQLTCTRPGCISHMFPVGFHTQTAKQDAKRIEADGCGAFLNGFEKMTRLIKVAAVDVLERRKMPSCQEPQFRNASSDEVKAILYRLERLRTDISKTKGCIAMIDVKDKIKLSTGVVAKIQVTLTYPIGQELHCFSDTPLGYSALCARDGRVSAPAKVGEMRELMLEVNI